MVSKRGGLGSVHPIVSGGSVNAHKHEKYITSHIGTKFLSASRQLGVTYLSYITIRVPGDLYLRGELENKI